ncbi:LLM class flavin-dependent oxidoreductase [Parachryseolinea silvisoli]|uniref:LLM class flavin-dependent oxidoreductase n=1 Tax=Parachryseolinea silvisoli TaxID=2873601 RepID=UPI002265B737|nr:LLM class flavin-dependent oxidoreductase [Parachryseolinea silvisoli]MCD9017608.1 LLM class flavin-dependent oxidoreductase [Parachryseolinea silvisoli]
MELGIGMFGDNHYDASGKPLAAGERLRELIEEIKLMDEVGIDFFGIGEHHRPDYAVSVPEIILAAAATVTKKIKLGSAVTVLSSSDPVRIYQSFATIDQLSNGRAELMAGRGSFIESFPLYGFNLNDYDALFDEKLELLLQIDRQQPITWKGKYRAPLQEQEVLPRPLNDHLDIWLALGGTPQSVARAGKLGLPVVFAIIGGNPAQFQPLFQYYKELYESFGHDMSKFRVGVHMHSFFGENSIQIADEYYPVYSAQMNRVGRTRGWPPFQRDQFDYGRGNEGAYLFGDANEAIDKILHMHELFGITRFSAHLDVGGPSHASLLKAIEIYGTRIAPKIREALRQ